MQLRTTILTVIVAIAIASPHSAKALWPQGGLGVAIQPNQQAYTVSVSDGAGGAIMAWYDSRSGSNIYAQRVDGYGNPKWAPGGIPVCTGSPTGFYMAACADGQGGIIVAWSDYRSGSSYDVYAQRLDAAGSPLWTANGVALCTAAGHQLVKSIVADGTAGAIVAWEDQRSGGAYDIYTRRVTATGVVAWTVDGVAIATGTNSKYEPRLASDGAGGAVVTWEGYGPGNPYIWAQRINNSGATLWTANGVVVCGVPGQNAQKPEIASLGLNGVIIVWRDTRGDRLYAQKVLPGGTGAWAANGVPVCAYGVETAFTGQKIVPDGSGGAIVVWPSPTYGGFPGVYAQRLNSQGVEMWTACGVTLCTVGQNHRNLTIAPDGAGGVVAAWTDDRVAPASGFGTYTQRVNSGGSPMWTWNGVLLGNELSSWNPSVCSDGAGGIIVAWSDYTLGSDDLYAQRVERNGHWGIPAPEIIGVRDVPGDQGGQMYVAWNASRLDPWPNEQVYQYSVWRALNPAAASTALSSGDIQIADVELDPGTLAPGAVRVEQLAGTTYYWQLINYVTAWGQTGYSDVVPTLFDSTAVSAERHYFQVMAHSYSGYWASPPDSGYSVDNLAPAAPLQLTAQRAGNDVQLTWRRSHEGDLGGYAVYRGTAAGLSADPTVFLAGSPDTLLTDVGAPLGELYYIITALDVHQNQSAPSNEAMVSGGPTGVGDTPHSYVLSVSNFPNPFNPRTTVSYTIPAQGNVSVAIYDARGARVATLVNNESRDAGAYRVEWNGRASSGLAVPSGIYFARIVQGDAVRSRKMVVLK